MGKCQIPSDLVEDFVIISLYLDGKAAWTYFLGYARYTTLRKVWIYFFSTNPMKSSLHL